MINLLNGFMSFAVNTARTMLSILIILFCLGGIISVDLACQHFNTGHWLFYLASLCLVIAGIMRISTLWNDSSQKGGAK